MFDLNEWMPAIVALLGSAGLWSFLSVRAKNKHEKALKEREDRAEFSETLKEQVDRLSAKLDHKTAQIEALLTEMAELRAELAAAKATIKHLEQSLMNRG